MADPPLAEYMTHVLGCNRPRAVCVSLPSIEGKGGMEYAEEMKQKLQPLMKLKHPNIVQYFGTAKDQSEGSLILLLEPMDQSLTTFLGQYKSRLPYYIQLDICHDMAEGLAYLHSKGIIHRNLTSNTVLLKGSRAKVTDYWMSTINPQIHHTAMAYMPAEVLAIPALLKINKLDWFCYGVLTLQIVTNNPPEPKPLLLEAVPPVSYLPGVPTPVPAVLTLVETERRKDDIAQMPTDSPLAITILEYTIKRATSAGPTDDEVLRNLSNLKMEKRYHTSKQLQEQ